MIKYTKKFAFKNRHGLLIRGEVIFPEHQQGFAFVQHGLSGHRQQPHMRVMTQSTLVKGNTSSSAMDLYMAPLQDGSFIRNLGIRNKGWPYPLCSIDKNIRDKTAPILIYLLKNIGTIYYL